MHFWGKDMNVSTTTGLPDAQVLYERLLNAVREMIEPLPREQVHLVGILSGGAWLAEQMHKDLALDSAMGSLNISFYRDDFDRIGLHTQTTPSDISFEVAGAHIILVDDVLYTGRTIRAAMNELFDYGRPASIRLVVLADRAQRQLPIQADYAAWTVPPDEQGNLVLERLAHGRFSLTLEHEAH